MNYDFAELEAALSHIRWNSDEICKSKICVCISCGKYFSSSTIRNWRQPQGNEIQADIPIFDQRDATCPHCNEPTVIGDNSELPVQNPDFMLALKGHWTDRLYANH